MPSNALHAPYALEGAYADCYSTLIAREVTQAQFVEAFYTTWLFKLERWILSWTVKKPSTDVEARALARDELPRFAAWTEEARAPDQLLMCDFLKATRSWFMVERGTPGQTRLYFGSVVTSRKGTYRALLGFHKLYSRALLAVARSRLGRL